MHIKSTCRMQCNPILKCSVKLKLCSTKTFCLISNDVLVILHNWIQEDRQTTMTQITCANELPIITLLGNCRKKIYAISHVEMFFLNQIVRCLVFLSVSKKNVMGQICTKVHKPDQNTCLDDKLLFWWTYIRHLNSLQNK